jgi:hypothetical protein
VNLFWKERWTISKVVFLIVRIRLFVPRLSRLNLGSERIRSRVYNDNYKFSCVYTLSHDICDAHVCQLTLLSQPRSLRIQSRTFFSPNCSARNHQVNLFVYRRKCPYSMCLRTLAVSLTLAFRCSVLTGGLFIGNFLVLCTETCK